MPVSEARQPVLATADCRLCRRTLFIIFNLTKAAIIIFFFSFFHEWGNHLIRKLTTEVKIIDMGYYQ